MSDTAARTSGACDLCGLPLIGRGLREEQRTFCCEGCRRVWSAAETSGFADLLSAPGDRACRAADASSRKAAAAAAAGASRETLRIEGMWCASCALVLEDALLGLDGVLDAEVSYAASLARLTWDPAVVDRDTLLERVGLLGYGAQPARLAAEPSGDDEGVFIAFFVAASIDMWIMWPTLLVLYPAFASGDYASVRVWETFTGAMALVVLLYPGWTFISGAWRAARVGRVTMDTLVVLGTWTAWLYSVWATLTSSGPTYFESAAMITGIVLLGRWLEALGQRDATAAVAALAAQLGEVEAWVLPEAAEQSGSLGPAAALALAQARRVPARELAPGTLFAVRAGEQVPADGVVVSGASDVDVARLTGEPLPAGVGPDDEVWAGAINLTDTLVVRATRVGDQTLSGRLALLAEDAVFAKSHAQRLADVAASIFVPAVLALAAATMLITGFSGGLAEGVSRAVAVLVVACPCALGLAVPLAVVNAVGAGSERGLLIRGGAALERAGDIEVVAFDKTGTLTTGRPRVVTSLHEQPGLYEVAAALEASDPHPVASAIREAKGGGGAQQPLARDVQRRPGAGVVGDVDGVRALVGSERLLEASGIEVPARLADDAAAQRARGRIVVWVAQGEAILGGIVLEDEIRADAHAALEWLARNSVQAAIVSGDAAPTVRAVADALGITSATGDVLPHDKERVVRELASTRPAEGHALADDRSGGVGDPVRAVAFVGDGINDAAALAASDLAIVVDGASDVAQLAADVVLLGAPPGSRDGVRSGARPGGPLATLPPLLAIARSTRRVVRENLVWAFTYNLVTLPLAVFGVLSPIWAAIAMALSSLAVVANSWRLRFAGRTDR